MYPLTRRAPLTQDEGNKNKKSSASGGGGGGPAAFADFFLFEGETSRLLVCRGTELDFYDNGRAGEKDVTDSNQVAQSSMHLSLPEPQRHALPSSRLGPFDWLAPSLGKAHQEFGRSPLYYSFEHAPRRLASVPFIRPDNRVKNELPTLFPTPAFLGRSISRRFARSCPP